MILIKRIASSGRQYFSSIALMPLIWALVALTGCTQMLPARATLISPGVYQLRAYGNSFAKRETLQAKFAKKAEKLCGAQHFSWQDDDTFEVKQERTYNNGGTQTNYYVVLTRTVKCHTR